MPVNKKQNRIQLQRKKGWRMPEGAIKIDRTTLFGNPFPCPPDDADQRAWAVGAHYEWLTAAIEGRACRTGTVFGALETANNYKQARTVLYALRKLRGKTLACWCKPSELCHGDSLIKILKKYSDRKLIVVSGCKCPTLNGGKCACDICQGIDAFHPKKDKPRKK